MFCHVVGKGANGFTKLRRIRGRTCSFDPVGFGRGEDFLDLFGSQHASVSLKGLLRKSHLDSTGDGVGDEGAAEGLEGLDFARDSRFADIRFSLQGINVV